MSDESKAGATGADKPVRWDYPVKPSGQFGRALPPEVVEALLRKYSWESEGDVAAWGTNPLVGECGEKSEVAALLLWALQAQYDLDRFRRLCDGLQQELGHFATKLNQSGEQVKTLKEALHVCAKEMFPGAFTDPEVLLQGFVESQQKMKNKVQDPNPYRDNNVPTPKEQAADMGPTGSKVHRCLLQPYTVWVHKKTRSLYLVLGVARCSTNGREAEESVRYWSFAYKAERYREVGEFLDGRFEPVDLTGFAEMIADVVLRPTVREQVERVYLGTETTARYGVDVPVPEPVVLTGRVMSPRQLYGRAAVSTEDKTMQEAVEKAYHERITSGLTEEEKERYYKTLKEQEEEEEEKDKARKEAEGPVA